LSENNLIGILIDQDTEVRGMFVDFYGKPAFTPIGAAMLAMDSGAPVLPMFYLKKPDDTYVFIIEKEIPLIMTGNRRQDMEENTFTKLLKNISRSTRPSGSGCITAGRRHRKCLKKRKSRICSCRKYENFEEHPY
jgi:hypothetical protein